MLAPMRTVAMALVLAACSSRGSDSRGSGSAAPHPPMVNDARAVAIDAPAAPADAPIPATPSITGLLEMPAIKGNTDNLFGSGLALSATELFIGESLAGHGRVHVYALDNGQWKKTATLQPAKTDQFGADVDVDADTLAV